MAEQMKIEYINPFLVAGTSVLSDMCGLKLTAGKPYVKTTSFDSDYIVISLGVTGQIAGQVLLAFHNDVACDIASKMNAADQRMVLRRDGGADSTRLVRCARRLERRVPRGAASLARRHGA